MAHSIISVYISSQLGLRLKHRLFIGGFLLLTLLSTACSENGLIATSNSDPNDKGEGSATEIQIDSISPQSGYNNEITSVVISGEGFGDDEDKVKVLFDMQEADVYFVSDDEIHCDAPATDSQGAVKVTVEIEGKGTKAKKNGFTYLESEIAPAIEISSFSPNSVELNETISVTIKGKGFGDDDSGVSVFFGDESDPNNEAEISSISDDEIECEVPVKSTAQSVKIKVVVGENSAVSSTSFSYQDSASIYIDADGITPHYGPTGGDNEVTIKGGNFTSDVVIKFQNKEADCDMDSETQLTCTVPEQTSSGSVTVTAWDEITEKSYSADSGYTYYDVPSISSVSNDFISSTDDDYNVVISGSHFKAGSMKASVTIDGEVPSNCSVSESSITCFDVSGTPDENYTVVVDLSGIGSDEAEDTWASREEPEEEPGTLTLSGSSSVTVSDGIEQCVKISLTASRAVSESTEIEIDHDGEGDLYSNSSCTNSTSLVTIANGGTVGSVYYLTEGVSETVKFNTFVDSSDGDIDFKDASEFSLTVKVMTVEPPPEEGCSSDEVEIDDECYTKKTMYISSYCSSLFGSSYGASFNTTYNAWECSDGSKSQSIAMEALCRYQLNSSNARAANSQSPSSTSNQNDWYCYEADTSVEGDSHPTITSLSDTYGAISKNSITITGENLSGTSIYFDKTQATCSSVTSTEAVCTTPSYVPRTVNVVASTGSKYSAAKSYGFNAPLVYSLSPSSGTQAGGTQITITGKYFGTDSSKIRVSIGGYYATDVTVSEPDSLGQSTITAKTASSSIVTSFDLEVYVLGSDSNYYGDNKRLGLKFTYTDSSIVSPPSISSISPKYLLADGGIPVTITGSNLSGATVTVGGASATVTSSSSSQLVFSSVKGTGANSYTVKVSNSLGSVSETLHYVNPPKITKLYPSSGVTPGGRKVKIKGENFSTNHKVYMNGSDITSKCDRNSSTEIICTTPEYSSCSGGSVNVQVKNLYNSGVDLVESGTAPYTYSNKPTITNITKEGKTSTVSSLTEGVKYEFHGTNFNDIGSGTDPKNDVVVVFSKNSSSYSTNGCSVNNYGTKLTCTIKDTTATSTNDWKNVTVSIKNKFKGCSNQTSDNYANTVTIKGS